MEPDPGEDGGGVFDEPDPAIPEEIDAREAARIRRRDHDAGAQDRDLMRPGMGKVFKQIDEAIVRRAKPAHGHGHHGRGHST